MSALRPKALERVASSLVDEHDIAGALANILDAVLESMDAEVSGIQVVDREGRLEVLAASSHQLEVLELFDSQAQHGPSIEACSTATDVTASRLELIRSRWSGLGEAMSEAGLASVLSCPLSWKNEPLGAMTVLGQSDAPFRADDIATLRTFAAMAMIVVTRTDQIPIRTAAQRVDEALATRVLIELAKGVIAYTEEISMADAYATLKQRATADRIPLTVAALRVVGKPEPT